MASKVRTVLTGQVMSFGPNGEPSAFRKSEASGAVCIESLGLVGDQQADRKHHGGPDKALLHYAYDHYSHWRAERPELASHLNSAGAFGENISTVGFAEDDVCVGDRFRLGTALVEISQGRQPCWKLGHRFGSKEMVRDVIRTGRAGWYYRVIEPGLVRAGARIDLLDRPYPQWTVATVFRLLVGVERDSGALNMLRWLSPLSRNWRARAERRHQNLTANR